MRRFVHGVIRYRLVVVGLTLLVTAGLALPLGRLRVDIDPSAMLPRAHPYVATTNRVEQVFGSKYVVVIGVTPKAGDALTPHVLGKVERITAALGDAPGVVANGVLSLSARRAKSIAGSADGMAVRPLMERVPETPREIEALRRAVAATPAYLDAVVSRDLRTALIWAEFGDPARGFRAILDAVDPIVEREREASVEIAVSGHPAFLAAMERVWLRKGLLFPIAVLVTGLIHYEAFRTLQGLVLPLVTALLAVLWGLGIMGLAGVPLDVFNVTTPILILAVAAGHAVQILKRYYEEYHRLRERSSLAPQDASRAAVVEAMTRVGPVMLTAGGVAALSFLSLATFEIATIRTFGVFTALGIVSALVLEMTFIPALRSWLPAPGPADARRERGVWGRLTGGIAAAVTGPRRRRLDAGIAIVVAAALAGASTVVVDNSMKAYFAPGLPLQQDDRVLNERSGGTNRLYVVLDGRGDDAMKEPRVLQKIEATQRFLEAQPHVGKTLSVVDFVKRMNRAVHADDPAHDRIPESRERVSELLLLHSMSGEPGDLDAYVDYPYRTANIWVFLRTDATAEIRALIERLTTFLAGRFGDEVGIGIGGSVPMAVALTEVMVRGKVLNIAQIAAAIFLISALVFRSFAAGLLVLAPLGLAVVATFGLMGAAGIPLNIPTSVVAPMAVGIGADYAIYLMARLREELAGGADETTAVARTLTTAGTAILFVATAIAGGYGVLLLSWDFRLHMWLGLLIAVSMLVSCAGSLLLLPRLIALLRPRFIFGVAGGRPAIARNTLAAVVAAGALGLAPAAAQAEAPTAREIMERNATAGRVSDSLAEGTMTLISRAGQERERRTFGVTKLQPNGSDRMRMLRFLSPPDVRGTATLLIERSGGEDDLWVYLPAAGKVRRLVAASKRDSFVGTDFSWGDVLGHRVEDWEHRLVGEEARDGQPCFVVESVPRTEAIRSNSGYSRRVEWIGKGSYVTLRAEMWDLSGRKLKTLTATDVRPVDPARGKWQAMRLEMLSLQTGHRTVIRYETYKVNQQVGDELFTTRYLEREP